MNEDAMKHIINLRGVPTVKDLGRPDLSVFSVVCGVCGRSSFSPGLVFVAADGVCACCKLWADRERDTIIHRWFMLYDDAFAVAVRKPRNRKTACKSR